MSNKSRLKTFLKALAIVGASVFIGALITIIAIGVVSVVQAQKEDTQGYQQFMTECAHQKGSPLKLDSSARCLMPDGSETWYKPNAN